jgi:hypothetical protein
VVFDLGQTQSVGRLRWFFAVDGLNSGLQIDSSNDQRSWSTVDKPGPVAAGAWQEFVLSAPVDARYIRFLFLNNDGTDQLGGLAEVKILPS